MATGGLYGNSGTGALVATPGAESSGLYGSTTSFGGTYFEWFIFQEAATQPATPTGGSWSFGTNTGTAPSGWTLQPPSAPVNQVWVSIALVNSRSTTSLVWSVPGLFGVVPQITFGTVITGSPGTNAAVVNTGTAPNPNLIFTIPRGDTGATGATGAPGTAATIAVGTTTTGVPGSFATVVNSGTSNAAIFDFTIPRGDVGPTGPTGATGATGTAATIAAGTTTTSNPGTSASVTNSGTSSAAVFDFTIPRGAGVNSGGTAGQFLTKASSTDYDTTWTTITGGLDYQGTWNASTNTPTLASGVGTGGYYYVVSVAGTTNLDGITDWQVGDWVIFNGTAWQKLDQTNLVTSVAGRTGAVVLTTADIGGLGTIATQNANSVAITGGTINGTSIGASTPSTGQFTSLTVNDNTTLGSSNSDTTTFNGRIASEFTPSTANTYDLGRNSHEWRNLYLTGTASVGTLTASADSSFTSTGAVQLSSGTTAQRPTGAAGKLRFNTTTTEFEGYNGTAWASVGGSAISNDTSTATNLYPLFASSTTGTAANVYTSNAQYLFKPSTGELSVKAPRASNGIVVNSATISSDYTIAAGDNGGSFGPVSVASGITVTVSSGSVWTVV